MKPFNRRIRITEPYRTDPAVKRLVKNFESSPNHPRARIFKSDHASTVAALPVDERWFVVKIYHSGTRLKGFFRFFRKSRGHKTWAAVHYLKSVNIPTADPVALVEDRLFFLVLQTCFISKFIKGVDAHTYMRDGDIGIQEKRLAAANIIESIEKMHSLGIAHKDTKDDNIIIQDGRIYWIDLDSLIRTRLRPILARKQRRDWWLLLYNWRDVPQVLKIFLDEVTHRFGYPFAHRIMTEMIRKRRKKLVADPSGKGLACLENLTAEMARLAQNDPAGGTGGSKNRHYLLKHNWTQKRVSFVDPSGKKRRIHIHIAENTDSAFWEAAALKFWTGSLDGLKIVPSSTAAKVFSGFIQNYPECLYFKQFFPRNKRDHLKQRFRKSRADRDLKGIRLALDRGLHVPKACCVIEEPSKKTGALSAIITAEVKDAIQVHLLLEKLTERKDFRARRQLMRALGREMARWHVCGMRHGDARAHNILCRIENPCQGINAANINFWWLDNERSRPVLRKRELLRNLVQLNMTRSGVTLTDRMRFWRAYWADAGRIYHFRKEKTLLKNVADKTRKRWIEFGWLPDQE
ncbi:MAG: lipopolysaccharide kinase InaA family protein [Desulfobacterales bacterium]